MMAKKSQERFGWDLIVERCEKILREMCGNNGGREWMASRATPEAKELHRIFMQRVRAECWRWKERRGRAVAAIHYAVGPNPSDGRRWWELTCKEAAEACGMPAWIAQEATYRAAVRAEPQQLDPRELPKRLEAMRLCKRYVRNGKLVPDGHFVAALRALHCAGA